MDSSPKKEWTVFQTLNSPAVATLVEECTQYLNAGLIGLAANKVEEIFTTAADTALVESKG